MPQDHDKVTVDGKELTWHAVDTKLYNVNLYHLAYALGKPTSNVLFWVVTTVKFSGGNARRATCYRIECGVGVVGQW